jgi:hypothetical protein
MTERVSFPGALKPGFAVAAGMLLLSVHVNVSAQQNHSAAAGASPTSKQRQFLDRHCAACLLERIR